jgi:hypothetical protein
LARASLPEANDVIKKAAAIVGNEDTPVDVVDAFHNGLYAFANKFATTANMFWGVWAVIQAKYSPIDFDFLKYAGDRLGGYRKQRKQFL